MTEQKGDIRIYVACLAAYNNGWLHGRWIDAAQDVEAIRAEVTEMLAASPISDAEEWAIHDYEGFGDAPISEYEGLDNIADKAAFIAEHGALGGKLIAHFGGELKCARYAIEDHYLGQYACMADYAREITEETNHIAENLDPYIDYEAMGRDMALCEVYAIETGPEELHIFWNC